MKNPFSSQPSVAEQAGGAILAGLVIGLGAAVATGIIKGAEALYDGAASLFSGKSEPAEKPESDKDTEE